MPQPQATQRSVGGQTQAHDILYPARKELHDRGAEQERMRQQTAEREAELAALRSQMASMSASRPLPRPSSGAAAGGGHADLGPPPDTSESEQQLYRTLMNASGGSEARQFDRNAPYASAVLPSRYSVANLSAMPGGQAPAGDTATGQFYGTGGAAMPGGPGKPFATTAISTSALPGGTAGAFASHGPGSAASSAAYSTAATAGGLASSTTAHGTGAGHAAAYETGAMPGGTTAAYNTGAGGPAAAGVHGTSLGGTFGGSAASAGAGTLGGSVAGAEASRLGSMYSSGAAQPYPGAGLYGTGMAGGSATAGGGLDLGPPPDISENERLLYASVNMNVGSALPQHDPAMDSMAAPPAYSTYCEPQYVVGRGAAGAGAATGGDNNQQLVEVKKVQKGGSTDYAAEEGSLYDVDETGRAFSDYELVRMQEYGRSVSNPYKKNAQKAVKVLVPVGTAAGGAVAGALVGAGIGAAAGGFGAPVGAVVGAVIGGSAGGAAGVAVTNTTIQRTAKKLVPYKGKKSHNICKGCDMKFAALACGSFSCPGCAYHFCENCGVMRGDMYWCRYCASTNMLEDRPAGRPQITYYDGGSSGVSYVDRNS